MTNKTFDILVKLSKWKTFAKLAIVLCMLTSGKSFAQNTLHKGQYLLNHIGISNGLNSNRVFSILQTADHATWISTKHGVDRYNGHRIKGYNLASTKRFSDAGGREIRLLLAENNTLLAYDNKGKVYLYNVLADRFVLQTDISTTLKRSIYLNNAYPYQNKGLWLAMNEGFAYLDKGTQKVTQILRNVRCNYVTEIQGGVVVGADNGLFFYDTAQKTIRKVWGKAHIQSLFFDKTRQQLWIGTFHNGMEVLQTKTWQSIPKPFLHTLPQSFPIRSITQKDTNTLLVGIDGSGVYAVFANNGASLPLFQADGAPEEALNDNGIYTIFNDEKGNIWMGSYSGGVTYATTNADVARLIRHKPDDTASLISNGVNAVMQANDGKVWYATNQGVSIYNPKKQQWNHLLKGVVALALCQNSDGTVFIGTYGDGVYSKKQGGSLAKVMSVKQGNLRSNYAFSIFSENDNDVWVGCLDGDLVHLRHNKPRFYPIHYVQQLVKTPTGGMAAATAVGLYTINPTTNQTHYYNLFNAKGISDANNMMLSALFTSRNEVLLGTDGGGIYRYNLRTNQCQQITTDNGLPSNTVLALIKDAMGRIWISTENGLATLPSASSTKVINNNSIRFVEREYNRAAACQTQTGQLIFGSTSGAIVIDPAKMMLLSAPKELNITGFTLLSEPEKQADETENIRTMLAKGELLLNHKQNTFDINFESIDYKYQANIVYRYRLEGYDAVWSSADNAGEAHYTNVPPGHYTFVVEAISKHDGKVMSSKSIEIVIHQPWYNTIWAWILYLFIIVAMGIFAWNYYRERLRRRYFNQKMAFFINTAHDIRTPLSLVLAPLNDIAHDATLSLQSRKYLEMARENGDKLLKMVTQLLDFQRSDRRKETMHVQQFSLQKFVESYHKRFLIMAEQKHINFVLKSLQHAAPVWLDRDMADKILENLLSNALKYTPEGGNVTLALTEEDDHYTLRVTDNGIGIPQADQRHIFKNFYRASNAVNSQQPGSGLGLMLTQRLAAIQGGKLTFESFEGKGTSFFLTLRKGKEHLAGYIVKESELPLMPQPAKAIVPVDSMEQGDEMDENKSVLLFVDDNEALRSYISQAFSADYKVLTAASGEEALDIIRQQECDIMVSDVMMPGMSGNELCRRIKHNKDTAWLPVILLTAKSERDFVMEGLQNGADDYVPKPFDTDVLRLKIAITLQNRRRLAAYYMQQSVALTKPKDHTEKPQTATQPMPEASAEDEQFIRKATQIVLQNISNFDFNITLLCREMAMSRTLFYGKLKTLTGKTPQDFIRIIRLEHAAGLLAQGKSVANTSVATGFVNAKHFATQFKKHFGVSPSKYAP